MLSIPEVCNHSIPPPPVLHETRGVSELIDGCVALFKITTKIMTMTGWFSVL